MKLITSNPPQPPKLRISIPCLDKINKYIASHPPERGGALLGPVGKPIITDMIPDPQAQTTGATYFPSLELTERVQQVEKLGLLEFKGVIHSHPRSLDRPSEPDKIAFREGLKINPHMEYFVAPIVTMDCDTKSMRKIQTMSLFFPPLMNLMPLSSIRSNQLLDHELPLGDGKISFYIAYRSQENEVTLKTPIVEEISEDKLAKILPKQAPILKSPPEIARMQLQEDLENICHIYGSDRDPEIFWTETPKGIPILAARVILNGGLELLFLINEFYPDISPNVLVTLSEREIEELQIPW